MTVSSPKEVVVVVGASIGQAFHPISIPVVVAPIVWALRSEP